VAALSLLLGMEIRLLGLRPFDQNLDPRIIASSAILDAMPR
jgi:hypothetical protein